jgi:hypothetical protein
MVEGQNQPQAIAADATNIYWTNYGDVNGDGNGTVMKLPLQGGTPTVIASQQGHPYAIAVDSTSVYWSTIGDGFIRKATPK